MSLSAFAAPKPVKIARLPVIFAGGNPDYDTCVVLETKIARAVHVPLNGTLKLVEYLDAKKSAKELNIIWQNMRAENKKTKLKDTMRPLAKKINADIVVCPVLLQYNQMSLPFVGADYETKLTSSAAAELIVYDSRTDELIDKKTSRFFDGSANTFGTASYLAKECFDRVIDKTGVRRKITAIRGE